MIQNSVILSEASDLLLFIEELHRVAAEGPSLFSRVNQKR